MNETTIGQVQKKLKKREYCVIDKKEGLVVVFDRMANMKHGEERIKRIYRITSRENLVEVDFEKAISRIMDALHDKLSLREVLAEILRTSSPDDIMKALKALESEKATVKKEDGCLALTVVDEAGKDVAWFAIGAK